MTRLDYLISQTLGRSPYDDEIIYNEDPLHVPGTVRTGQQYDNRGRPMNRETNQQTRNLTRAQNEVLAAAGIIESNEVAKAKDAATKKGLEAREDDIQKAYRRRAYGQIALTCGVWGACGLRRRIELYRDYSQHPLMYLIQREHQTSSWLKMFGAGLPALMLNRAIGNVAHFININPFSSATKTIVTYASHYVMFHYKYFAILQQLGLVPCSFPYFVVPTLSFMVPFSSTSPFYLPKLPSTWTSSAALTFASQCALVVAPVVFLQLWYRISNYIISEIYDPIYNSLPYPSNVPAAQAIERAAELELREWREGQERERRERQQVSYPQSQFIENLDAQGVLDSIVDTRHEEDDSDDTDDASTTTCDVSEYNELNPPPRPSNPTPTSDPSFRDSDTPEGSPEGSSQSNPSNDRDNNFRGGGAGGRARSGSRERSRPRRDSYASTHSSLDGETTTTLITFDVEATDEPMPTTGSYSAELRQAPDERSGSGLRGGHLGEGVVEYNVTAMSIMPAHLFADGVTVLLSTAMTVVLESIMVRAVAASWLGKKTRGGTWAGNREIWPVLSRKGDRLPWYGVGNIGIVFLGDLVMTGVIWFGCMGCMWVKDRVVSDEVEGIEKGRKDGGVRVHED